MFLGAQIYTGQLYTQPRRGHAEAKELKELKNSFFELVLI
jgi:hypothetical protein